jgi:hypothetical protein
MSSPDQCEFEWNPGTWPYTKRCKVKATTTRNIQESCDADTIEIKVCDEHAQLIDQKPTKSA